LNSTTTVTGRRFYRFSVLQLPAQIDDSACVIVAGTLRVPQSFLRDERFINLYMAGVVPGAANGTRSVPAAFVGPQAAPVCYNRKTASAPAFAADDGWRSS
jgi:hypothetical protein